MDNFLGDKKIFWKVVKRRRKGSLGKEEKAEAKAGTLLVEKRWAE